MWVFKYFLTNLHTSLYFRLLRAHLRCWREMLLHRIFHTWLKPIEGQGALYVWYISHQVRGVILNRFLPVPPSSSWFLPLPPSSSRFLPKKLLVPPPKLLVPPFFNMFLPKACNYLQQIWQKSKFLGFRTKNIGSSPLRTCSMISKIYTFIKYIILRGVIMDPEPEFFSILKSDMYLLQYICKHALTYILGFWKKVGSSPLRTMFYEL